jgi:dihydrofolate reductase
MTTDLLTDLSSIKKKPALIAAVAVNGVIGCNGRLPWYLPKDLRWFRRHTWGKAVIMGRKTWQSLRHPLVGRMNLVLSRDTNWHPEGAKVCSSLDRAIKDAQWYHLTQEPMIIGGAALFAEALPLVGRIYLTEIGQAYEGDTFFPVFDRSEWKEVSRQYNIGFPPYSFTILERGCADERELLPTA